MQERTYTRDEIEAGARWAAQDLVNSVEETWVKQWRGRFHGAAALTLDGSLSFEPEVLDGLCRALLRDGFHVGNDITRGAVLGAFGPNSDLAKRQRNE